MNTKYFNLIKQNIFYALFLSFIFIGIETYFRVSNENITNIVKLSYYFETIGIFLLLSFLPRKVATISLIILSTLFIIEIIHFNYFGYFMFPIEFILFVTKFNEVSEAGLTVLNILTIPTIFFIGLILSILTTDKITKHRLILNKIIYIYILILIIPIINTAIHYKKRTTGDRPSTNKPIIKNSLYVMKSFLGKTLPMYILDIQIVPEYKNPTFKITANNKQNIQTIVLVIGESLSANYMSLYKYSKNTTPKLLQMKKEHKILATKAISAGTYTDSSIPMILNIEKKPNAINDILSTKTNLFKLAKQNGYTTYFISTQSNDGFSYIRSYMGLKYIDKYIDSFDYGYDKYHSKAIDNFLIQELEKIDFSKRNFIVLNMVGSHEPYEYRVPKDFKPFGHSNHLEDYENSVAYTDKIITDMINFLQSKNKVLFLFTSDHGQHVTKQSMGKGNLKDFRDWTVPLVLYANFQIKDEIKKIFNKTTSHYNMGLLLAHYLRCNSLKYIDENYSYVNGRELSGNDGYSKYNLKTNKVQTIY